MVGLAYKYYLHFEVTSKFVFHLTMAPTLKKRRTGTRSNQKQGKFVVPRNTILSVASTLQQEPSLHVRSPPPRIVNRSAASTNNPHLLWEFTDDILYHIASYVSLPTERAAFFCRTISPLCRSAYHKILVDEATSKNLWSLVLAKDYGVEDKKISSKSLKRTFSGRTTHQSQERRSCARLRRSPLDQVRDAHRLMRDNSEISCKSWR